MSVDFDYLGYGLWVSTLSYLGIKDDNLVRRQLNDNMKSTSDFFPPHCDPSEFSPLSPFTFTVVPQWTGKFRDLFGSYFRNKSAKN